MEVSNSTHKRMKVIYILLSFLVLCQCSAKQNTDKEEEPTLKDRTGWVSDTISSGLIWYNYTGYYGPFDCNQTINVMEIDLKQNVYNLEFIYSEKADSLSSLAEKHQAVAGINATYFEPEVSFVKSNGHINSEVTLTKDHVRFWKHAAAIFYDKDQNTVVINKGTNTSYKESAYRDIMSGAPLLIDNYNPVGLYFIGNTPDSVLLSLDYEDYRRHQGVRHPRVAIAVTGNQKLLLITVDGRWQSSDGMSCRELTAFLQFYFNPMEALNLDGGGSTTMWIKERGASGSQIVNFPTDNKRYDHYGQRQINSAILIKKK